MIAALRVWWISRRIEQLERERELIFAWRRNSDVWLTENAEQITALEDEAARIRTKRFASLKRKVAL